MKEIPYYMFNAPEIDDPSVITVTSTSSQSATAQPVELRRTTDQTRLQFEPKIARKPGEQHPLVSGTLIYERKNRNEPLFPCDRGDELVSKGTIKSGGALKLALNSSETRALYDSLTKLYQVADGMDEIPRGSVTYVPLDHSARALLGLAKRDPSAARMILEKDVFELVRELLKLRAQGFSSTELSGILENLEDGNLQTLSSSLSIERLIRVRDEFEKNIDNSTEHFWQKFFERNAWIISQVLSVPCSIFESQAYVGGKSLGNKGSCLPDFLYRNNLTSNLAIVEIKTPETPLLGPKYRDKSYAISGDLSGSISQALSYKQHLLNNFSSLYLEEGGGVEAFSPRCVIIIGKTAELDDRVKTSTFENFRESLQGIIVLTYDELLQKIKDLITLLTDGDRDQNPIQSEE